MRGVREGGRKVIQEALRPQTSSARTSFGRATWGGAGPRAGEAGLADQILPLGIRSLLGHAPSPPPVVLATGLQEVGLPRLGLDTVAWQQDP